MIILTAANTPVEKTFEVNKNFSFKSVIQQTAHNARRFGYKIVVFDLGWLGIGEPFYIEDDSFRARGYYTKLRNSYRSKSLFKPDIIRKCLEEHKDFTVYLDGDALLHDRIDEIVSDDYDIGVTLRRPSEIESEWHVENADIVRYVNAGVIFFNPTEATFKFINLWKETTEKVKNDQKALNQLVCPEKYPEVNSICPINGVRVKYFSGNQYNFYYFDESLSQKIKILHFKGPVRRFYPFDWKMRLYCATVIPLANWLKSLLKKHLRLTKRER